MLTHKKRLYAEARMAGKNQTNSAIAAGCPEATARQAGCRYEKDPDVIAHFERHGFDPKAKTEKPKQKKAPEQKPIVVAEPMPESVEQEPVEAESIDNASGRYTDPLKFMEDTVNNEKEDPKLRLEAAKAWASYIHAKPGETGKKEEKKKRAEEVSKRFSVVRGGKK